MCTDFVSLHVLLDEEVGVADNSRSNDEESGLDALRVQEVKELSMSHISGRVSRLAR